MEKKEKGKQDKKKKRKKFPKPEKDLPKKNINSHQNQRK